MNTAVQAPKKTRTYLPGPVQFSLWQMVQAEYPTAEKTDKEFAAYAAEKLQTPYINEHHVAGARKVFSLESFSRRAKPGEGGGRPRRTEVRALLSRVEKLETAMLSLYKHLGYIPKD